MSLAFFSDDTFALLLEERDGLIDVQVRLGEGISTVHDASLGDTTQFLDEIEWDFDFGAEMAIKISWEPKKGQRGRSGGGDGALRSELEAATGSPGATERNHD